MNSKTCLWTMNHWIGTHLQAQPAVAAAVNTNRMLKRFRTTVQLHRCLTTSISVRHHRPTTIHTIIILLLPITIPILLSPTTRLLLQLFVGNPPRKPCLSFPICLCRKHRHERVPWRMWTLNIWSVNHLWSFRKIFRSTTNQPYQKIICAINENRKEENLSNVPSMSIVK